MLKKFNQFLIKENKSTSVSNLKSTKKKLDVFVLTILNPFIENNFMIDTDLIKSLDFEKKIITTYYCFEIKPPNGWVDNPEIVSSIDSLDESYLKLSKFFKSKGRSIYELDSFDIIQNDEVEIVNITYIVNKIHSLVPPNNELILGVELFSEELTITKLLNLLGTDESEKSFYKRDANSNIIGAYITMKDFHSSYMANAGFEYMRKYLKLSKPNNLIGGVLDGLFTRYLDYINHTLNTHCDKDNLKKIIDDKYRTEVTEIYDNTYGSVIDLIKSHLADIGMTLSENLCVEGEFDGAVYKDMAYIPMCELMVNLIYSVVKRNETFTKYDDKPHEGLTLFARAFMQNYTIGDYKKFGVTTEVYKNKYDKITKKIRTFAWEAKVDDTLARQAINKQ
jgi:hypothetical protein